MIGVVVWSKPTRQQAVIWCEDHAALAYLAGEENCACEVWPEPGDLLQLETEMVGDLRCARDARPLNDARLPLLPELLRRGSTAGATSTRHLRVVASGPGRVAAEAETPVQERMAHLAIA